MKTLNIIITLFVIIALTGGINAQVNELEKSSIMNLVDMVNDTCYQPSINDSFVFFGIGSEFEKKYYLNALLSLNILQYNHSQLHIWEDSLQVSNNCNFNSYIKVDSVFDWIIVQNRNVFPSLLFQKLRRKEIGLIGSKVAEIRFIPTSKNKMETSNKKFEVKLANPNSVSTILFFEIVLIRDKCYIVDIRDKHKNSLL